ncbi:MAG: DNA-directed RNA polymerase subunit beta [Oscillospiraceae bacterium]|nr:DNA-directed RNA polymerase subunit beta [Oscillospiraceae bacterium]
MSFAKRPEIREMPNLLEVQKNSYRWFLETGLREVFRDVAEITDHTGTLELTFIDYRMEETPKYSVDECKARDVTYAAPVWVSVRLRNRETEEIKEQEIFMGDFPLMTPAGTFIINGAERVVVSQIIRSPSVYFDRSVDPKTTGEIYTAQLIPYRGAWLEYETDASDGFFVRIDKNRKLPVTWLLRSIGRRGESMSSWLSMPGGEGGAETSGQIKEIFGEDERITATLERDACVSRDDALIEMYKRLRPGDPPTVDSADLLLGNMFFDSKRYEISKVGRYMFNKKLALWTRLSGGQLAQPVADPLTGEILAEVGEVLTRERAQELEARGVVGAVLDVDGRQVKVFSNGMVRLDGFVDFDPAEIGVRERVRFVVLRELLDKFKGAALREAITDNLDELIPRHIIPDDIFAAVNYINCLSRGIGELSDIDHLGNRRMRSVGELLQNQFRAGFSRMEKMIRDKMTLSDLDIITPQSLINVRTVTALIKEFFGSSALSQFMDQTNPLAELTHKRRLSALGPGGLSRERASFDVRDVHYTHYGRMCPVETPEGPNIGLISYLASYARVNEYGFIVAPFRRVDKSTGVVTEEIEYLTADMEDEYFVAQATEAIDETGHFVNERVTCRHRDEISVVESDRVDFVDVSPMMMVSVATAMIPFLENDDANRALMGANMQRQAVPLLMPEAPIVATGIEHKCAADSTVVKLAEGAGVVTDVSATNIKVRYDDGEVRDYPLSKFTRSNNGTCTNQRPVVNSGDRVEDGDVLADGPSTSNGELSLGKNILVGFMPWEGYNYEDAILINERLTYDDVFTSIHIEEHEVDARDTKLGAEEITRDIPGVGEDALRYLDERGIIHIGAEVRAGDILVGKVTPKGETDLTAEERLLRAIFGEKAREVRDTSLKVPHGESGIVVDVRVFTRENGDEMNPGVNMVVRCYIAQKRKISVGDKMAGRHGNKGVVSRILPQEDMPYLPDGTPLDIVLNPLGVPSRMNIGQVLEVHLGYAAKTLGWKVATPVFNGATERDIGETLKLAGLREDGKSVLYDGRTGEPFDNPVTVGYVYFLKLHHLVDDKIHARSTGPYSLVTQQPLGGKAQFGGQRFGEMEVWALEAYGAAYTLQEILTVKSDDTIGRVRTYEAIVKGRNIPKPGVPESFKVLVKELQSLCLNMRVLDGEGNEIRLKMDEDETDDFREAMREAGEFTADDKEFTSRGYSIGEIDSDGNVINFDEDDDDDDELGLDDEEDDEEDF